MHLFIKNKFKSDEGGGSGGGDLVVVGAAAGAVALAAGGALGVLEALVPAFAENQNNKS